MAVTGDGNRSETPVAMRASEPARRLDRLAPLIHELIAWDLVHRSESGDYVLQDDVQTRLRELSALRPQPTAQVYIGRLCQRCGVVGVTRLVDNTHVCASCNRSAAIDASADPPSIPSEGTGRHEGRSRWHRKAG